MSKQDSDEKAAQTTEEDELYQANVFSGWRKRRDENLVAELMGNPFVWVGAFIIAAAILLFALWPNSNNEETANQIENLAQKIEMLENRLFLLESNFENVSINPEADNQPFQNLESRIERMETAAHQRALNVNGALEGMGKKLSDLESKIEMARKSSSSEAPKKTKKPTVSPKKPAEYYSVVKGDTLYSISRKHGISVDTLLKINKISKNSPIMPGQKLKVSP